MSARSSLRGSAAIVGMAELPPRRYTEETTGELLTAVAHGAVTDAGLGIDDVDGLLVHPVPGVEDATPAYVAELIGIRPRTCDLVDLGGATGAGMVWRAAAAIATGMATAVLCVTGTGRRRGHTDVPAVSELPLPVEFEAPVGAVGPNVGYALVTSRYEHDHGPTDEARAKVAAHQRENAQANPDAVFHGAPLTEADVLSSEMVCDPLRKLEIVMPTGGAAAVLVAAPDRRTSSDNPPVWLLGAGERVTRSSMAWQGPCADDGMRDAARAAFETAGVRPADIGLLSLYDCYTTVVLLTLEAAGFCGPGDAPSMVAGADLRWSGDLPVNTHGGQLSFGQSGLAGGMSHVTEAVRQLRGDVAGRQVPDLELAYVHGNGGIASEHVGLVLGNRT